MPADNAPQGAPSPTPADPPKKKRRRGSNKCQRTKQFMVRCTPKEFADIAEDARAAGLRGAAYLRALGLKGNPGLRAKTIPPVENELLKSVRHQLGILNNNVNQMARKLNMGEFSTLSELRQVILDYPALRGAIFSAMGKEPGPEIQSWDEFVALAKEALEANPGAETVGIPTRLLLPLLSGKAASAAAPKPRGRKT